MNIYQEHGYKDRADYLANLAEDHGVPLETVQMLADLLGPNEDFDGLVVACEDYEDPDYDPTPYCSHCGAMKAKHCDCGPIAEND